MHRYDAETDRLARAIIDEALARVRLDPPPLDGPRSSAELSRVAGRTITEEGIGGDEALRVFRDVLAPACISVDHPRFLAFVPAAPTEASILFDLLVGASSLFGGTWLESAGAVHAENEALAFLVRESGMPESSGGVFVQGATIGNMSALVAARHRARTTRSEIPARWAIVTGEETHSSVASSAAVMDVDVIVVPSVDRRLRADRATEHLATLEPETTDGIFAVVATSGSTNLGLLDDLDGLADLAESLGAWFHVDGAYGLPGILDPRVADRYDGLDLADSIIVDPHKWLGAPVGVAATFVRDRSILHRAFTQGPADYLEGSFAAPDDVQTSLDHMGVPYDNFGVELSAPARGVQVWSILREEGIEGVAARVAADNDAAGRVARFADDHPRLESLTDPELSIACIRYRVPGVDDLDALNEAILRRLVRTTRFLPSATVVDGAYAIRPCFINVRRADADVDAFLETVVAVGDELAR